MKVEIMDATAAWNDESTGSVQTLGTKLVLPWNLNEWVEARRLRNWVLEEVAGLDWDQEVVTTWQTYSVARLKGVLRLLSYAYLTGVFESEEIVDACLRNLDYRSLCEGDIPTPRIIGRFRRDHRVLLKWVLSRVLIRLVCNRFELAKTQVPSGLQRYLVESATERLDLARHTDREAQGA